MKSLLNFINESYMINESEVVAMKKTRENLDVFKALDRSFMDLSDRLNRKPCSTGNKMELKRLFNAVLDGMGLPRRSEALKMLKPFGVINEETFAEFLGKSAEFFRENKFDMKMIKFGLSEKNQQKYDKYVRSNDYIELRPFDQDAYVPDDKDAAIRLLLIYDAKDPSNMDNVYEADYEGKIGQDTHAINMLKLDWSYQTGMNYYDARPILAYNYFGKGKDQLENYVIGKE